MLELELLSFVDCFEKFTTDVILKVRFFLPTDVPVFIQGRELQEQKQYWMESKPTDWNAGTWNEFSNWPTRNVLTREGIPSWNLGVVIRFHRGTSNGGHLAPAFVYHSTFPAPFEKYILHMRPNSTLKKVTCTIFKIVNDEEVEVVNKSLYGEKLAGEPFRVELETRDLPEGQMRLVIKGMYKNRTGELIREYEFYHKPQIR